MHELGIARNIVAIVAEAAQNRRVSRIVLEIGRFSGVSADAVAFCFPLAAEATPLADARLDIVEIAGTGRCTDCHTEFEMRDIFAACGCGSRAVTRLTGEELRVRSIDIETADNETDNVLAPA
jgi:hydrogenase nickel incorporation protein HypA/HybF